MKKRLNFRYRAQPYEGSKEDKLFKYIQKNPEEKNELILSALKAFYMPLAYKNEPNWNKKQLDIYIYKAITELTNQIAILASEGELEMPSNYLNLITRGLLESKSNSGAAPMGEKVEKKKQVIEYEESQSIIEAMRAMDTEEAIRSRREISSHIDLNMGLICSYSEEEGLKNN